MAPFDDAAARRVIAEELGDAAAPLLAALPATGPVAAASICQVYRLEPGALRRGALAIKVQPTPEQRD